jgi:SAM-dependent methyltransferase
MAVEQFLRETPSTLLARGVLEVGSDVDGRVLRQLSARGVPLVVGINPALTAEVAERLSADLPPGSRVEATDLRSSGLPAGTFGAIFSVAVFEHLIDFDLCLTEMHRLLIPGGRVFAAFGPIWSSGPGHHVFADVDGVQLRHWDPRLNPIGDHAQLLLSPEEMLHHITAARGRAQADAAVDWIYASDDLNRMFFEDYVAAFERSPFEVLRLTTDTEHIPAHRLAALKAAHPGHSVFDVRNAVVVLEKPEDASEQPRAGSRISQ